MLLDYYSQRGQFLLGSGWVAYSRFGIESSDLWCGEQMWLRRRTTHAIMMAVKLVYHCVYVRIICISWLLLLLFVLSWSIVWLFLNVCKVRPLTECYQYERLFTSHRQTARTPIVVHTPTCVTWPYDAIQVLLRLLFCRQIIIRNVFTSSLSPCFVSINILWISIFCSFHIFT